jgi:hypothetical protein
LPLIAFDADETLIDLNTAVPIFERIFGDANTADAVPFQQSLTFTGGGFDFGFGRGRGHF